MKEFVAGPVESERTHSSIVHFVMGIFNESEQYYFNTVVVKYPT